MDSPTNYFSGMGSGDAAILAAMASRGHDGGGALGGGLGAGLLGGLLASQLFGRRGFGDGDASGVVTPAVLAASQAEQTASLNNSTVLQTLGDIKAAVPLAEAQIQLALAGAQNDINANTSRSVDNVTNQVSQATQSVLAGQTALAQALSMVKDAVSANGIANLTATRDDGDKTRAAIAALAQDINANNIATLNRQLATAEAALLEQRSLNRTREVEVNVSQNVNQMQAQTQAQNQFQIQTDLLRQLLAHAQVAQATNANLIIGNSGRTDVGPQNANPINVRGI